MSKHPAALNMSFNGPYFPNKRETARSTRTEIPQAGYSLDERQRDRSSIFGRDNYEGRTERNEQLFFACELGTADEGECGGRWNQLLCYP